MKRRFPLSRLAYVVANPTAAAGPTIKQYFGLVWDATNCRWTYTSPDSTTAQTDIKTLAQVAAVNPAREPDFFETLKAAIVCDSLGKQMGSTDGYSSEHWYTYNEAALDGRVDYQVWQIGANIIDQYDSDSYPTRIYIGDKPATTAGTSGTWALPYDNTLHFSAANKSDYPREIYGSEDLPYMLGVMESWYRTQSLSTSDIDPSYTPSGGSNVDPAYPPPPIPAPPAAQTFPGIPSFAGHGFYEVTSLVQPILWNPNAPGSNPQYSGAPNYPAGFQIVAGDIRKNTVALAVTASSSDSWWMKDVYSNTVHSVSQYPAVGGLTPTTYSLASVGPLNVATGISPTYIQFQTSSTSTFREPYRLHAPLDPPGSNTAAYPGGIISSTDLEETPFTQALGFYTGKAWAGPMWTDSSFHSYLDTGNLSTPIRFHLQYKNPYASSPAFLTYDTIYFTYLGSSNPLCLTASDDSVNKIRAMSGSLRSDPRTNRWGTAVAQLCPFWGQWVCKMGRRKYKASVDVYLR